MSSWIEGFTRVHRFLYQISGGLVGHRLGKQATLLLYSTGARSGKRHSTTLAYYRAEGRYLVVASNWGKEQNPGWYYNLISHSRVVILVGTKKTTVDARPVMGDEYTQLWQLVTQQNSQYVEYQKGLNRRIPIMVLTPVNNEP